MGGAIDVVPGAGRAIVEKMIVDVDAILGRPVTIEGARDSHDLIGVERKDLAVDCSVLALECEDRVPNVRDRDPELRPAPHHFPTESDGSGEVRGAVVVAGASARKPLSHDTKSGMAELAEEIVARSDGIERDARRGREEGQWGRDDEGRDGAREHAASRSQGTNLEGLNGSRES